MDHHQEASPGEHEHEDQEQHANNQFEDIDLNVYEDDDEETLHHKLQAAKVARKRAEEDAKLLANRIQLLKQEEGKAWKKIEETKKRATEIVSLRQRNQEVAAQREERMRQKQEQEYVKQQQNRNQKEQLKQNIHNTKRYHEEKVKKEVEYLKMEKED